MENPTDAPVGKYCTCTRVWSLVCAGDAAAPVQRKQEAPLPSQLIIALSPMPTHVVLLRLTILRIVYSFLNCVGCVGTSSEMAGKAASCEGKHFTSQTYSTAASRHLCFRLAVLSFKIYSILLIQVLLCCSKADLLFLVHASTRSPSRYKSARRCACAVYCTA